MKLLSGQRFRVQKEDAFLRVQSGSLEVYAVTHERSSFQQVFLMELAAGEAAFPSLDEFGKVDIFVYAVGDTECEELSFASVSAGELCPLMRRWFMQLMEMRWLRLLANKGDDMLLPWKDGSLFDGLAGDHAALMEEFRENEAILSMMVGMKFHGMEKKLAQRLSLRDRQQKELLDESVGLLLGEDDRVIYDEGAGSAALEEATFVVQTIAKAFAMPADHIRIAPEIVKKLDQLGLIRRLTQKGGMQMRLVELTEDWYKKDSGVMLGYYTEDATASPGAKEKSLAAILPQGPGKYSLITAKHPKGLPVTGEVASRLDKDAFAYYPGLPARKLQLMDLVKFMLRQCWKADWQAILLVSFVAGLIPLVTPVITQTIFQDIIPTLDREGLATVTQVTMVTGFTMAALSTVRSVAVMRFATHLDTAAEGALWGRLLSLPATFFRKFQSGELASRMQSLEEIKSFLAGDLAVQIFGFIFSFWSIALMCYYSMKLTAAAMVIWFFYYCIAGFILWQLLKAERNMVRAKNATAGILQQIFTGLAKFRVQGAESQAYHLWSRIFGEEWKWNYKIRWQSNYLSLIGSVQPFLLTLALYYIVFYQINTGPNGKPVQGITYADFLAFQAAYTGFNGTLNSILPLVGQLMGLKPHWENIKPILEAVPETGEDRMDADVLTGAIEARNLTFAYEDGGRNVLSDVSFRIAAGEHVAIVGRSGCGKSTLIRLLLGFEKPKSGAVYYDGQDLSDLTLSSVRSQMGVVLQNGQLMQGDIFTNIVGTSALTQEDAWAAAEAAGLADDIRQMPMGMQTVISEGSTNISGGQRQRILIARALAARPAIVVFDEATSALDNRTQSIVTESLDRMRATRLVVAHRLSTIRNADRIIVLDKGQIAESGTFEELVAKGGLFAGLVKRQVA